MKNWPGILVPLALCVGPAWGAEPSYDTFGAWSVVCDNGLACDARGFADDGGEAPELTFHRDAGPEAQATVTIYAPLSFDRKAVGVDGHGLELFATEWVSGGEGSSLTAHQPAAVSAFVDRIRHAAFLDIGRNVVPLKGVVAALSRMDARQGRTNGQTALIRRGMRPASVVPARPWLPYIPVYHRHIVFDPGEQDRLMAVAWKGQAHFIRSGACDPPTDNMRKFLKNGVYGLDQGTALVMIGCQMGPYQGNSVLFVVSRGRPGVPEPVRLPMPRLHRGDTGVYGPVLTCPDFDTATSTLTTVAAGRARNDCGMGAQWRWDGTHFVLTGMTLQEACGGSAPLGNWPTVYRSTSSGGKGQGDAASVPYPGP